MARPTKAQIEALDWGFQGEPYCNVSGNEDINLDRMDFAFLAEPFSGTPPIVLPPLDFAYQAESFCDVPGNEGIYLRTMDWAFLAEPFVRNCLPTVTPPAPSAWIPKIMWWW